ncbi:MAG: hypothetical protein PHT19_05815 [Methylococcus sp.]|nr:hypothetical protein [Methylococcus sp.]
MTVFTWVDEAVVWAIHEAQLAEHGGSAGVPASWTPPWHGPGTSPHMERLMRQTAPRLMASASPVTVRSSTAIGARLSYASSGSWS